MKPDIKSCVFFSPSLILPKKSRTYSMQRGYSAHRESTSFIAASIRLAISISPVLVKRSTLPISLIYILTGSVVLPDSISVCESAATASSAASSSVSSSSPSMSSSSSGVFSKTFSPISFRTLVISSKFSSSVEPSGRVSVMSAYVRYPWSLPS